MRRPSRSRRRRLPSGGRPRSRRVTRHRLRRVTRRHTRRRRPRRRHTRHRRSPAPPDRRGLPRTAWRSRTRRRSRTTRRTPLRPRRQVQRSRPFTRPRRQRPGRRAARARRRPRGPPRSRSPLRRLPTPGTQPVRRQPVCLTRTLARPAESSAGAPPNLGGQRRPRCTYSYPPLQAGCHLHRWCPAWARTSNTM